MSRRCRGSAADGAPAHPLGPLGWPRGVRGRVALSGGVTRRPHRDRRAGYAGGGGDGALDGERLERAVQASFLVHHTISQMNTLMPMAMGGATGDAAGDTTVFLTSTCAVSPRPAPRTRAVVPVSYTQQTLPTKA